MATKSAANQEAARRVVVAAGLAAADALSRVAGEPVLDPEDDFGGPMLDEELEREIAGEPVAPPAPPRGPVETPTPPPASLLALGPPPTDPLAAQEYLHRAMVLSAHDAMIDPSISAATRRRELRTIAAAAAKLMPDARRFEAEQLIKRDRDEIEKRKRVRARAAAEKRPAPGGARVIPLRPSSDEPSE